jgi:hypothetical protein
MPKLQCRCNYTIDLSPIPCPDEFYMISSEALESIYDAMESSVSLAEERLESNTRSVVVCPKCGRLYLSKSESNDYDVYVPQNMP